MKLMQILTLVTAMATAAVGQNTGSANNANAGGQQPGNKPPAGTTKASPSTKAQQPQTSPAKPGTGTAQGAAAGNNSTSKNAAVSSTPAKPAGNMPANNPNSTKTGSTQANTSATKTGATKTGGATPNAAASSTKGTTTAAPVAGTAATVAKPGTQPKTVRRDQDVQPQTAKKGTKKGAKQTKSVAAKATKPTAKTASKPAEKSTGPVAAVVAKPRTTLGGRRDPFVSPIRSQGNNVTPCTGGGKKCLSIPELVLAGTVKDISGKMMAVVVTGNKKTYTLRENDQVFNGSVEKITTDSVIFREFVKDAIGHESAREVVKKMNPLPVS